MAENTRLSSGATSPQNDSSSASSGARGQHSFGARGVIEALGCQALWGVMPIYWKLISSCSALLVLANRMVWSCAFMLLLAALFKRVRFGSLLREARARRTFLASGCVISVNWLVYIWATNSGHILEASFGYYLCPLVTVLFGVLFFHESMTRVQILAFVLAVAGVAAYFVIQGGMIWISIALAVSFSIYAAIKKKGGYPAFPGMGMESAITGVIGIALFALAAVFPAVWQITPPTPGDIAVQDETLTLILLVGGGALTAIPLLLYSAAANDVPLVALGFMQYFSPTIAMIVALAVFGETFTLAHGICFALVWIGLIGVGAETIYLQRKHAKAVASAQNRAS